MGLTPQAALAAVSQARSGERCVLDNPAFQAQMDRSLEGLYAVSFFDTARMLREGYGLSSLLCSGLANTVRSPRNDARNTEMILPPYREFVAGAKAVVGYAYVDGDDYVQEQRSDRSVLVNGTSFMGFLGRPGRGHPRRHRPGGEREGKGTPARRDPPAEGPGRSPRRRRALASGGGTGPGSSPHTSPNRGRPPPRPRPWRCAVMNLVP
jgi:hypothetical protein